MHTRGRTLHSGSLYDLGNRILFLGREHNFREYIIDLADVLVKQRLGESSEVVGLDASDEMLAVARRKAADKQASIEFHFAPVEKMPFEDDHFEVVLSSLMLHHLPVETKREGIMEIARVLKPGGRFVAVDFDLQREGLLSRITDFISGSEMLKENLNLIQRIMVEAGFTDMKKGKSGYPFIHYLTGKLENCET
jgi:demethylmenaquinone methyltransferase/2-methoxy-6-polyprenyl-1,4-benzoquinol methylase/phosphoethanolamine N-methyltransferase